MREKNIVYGFYRFGEGVQRVNREALWQVLRMHDVGYKLLSGIKNMYVDSSPCVRVKGVEREWFGIDIGVRQGCIISPWLFNGWHSDEGGENGDGKEGNAIPGGRERVEITWYLVYR